MAREQEKSEIKITDRRLFTNEGELRPDVAEQEEPAQAQPEADKQPAQPPPKRAQAPPELKGDDATDAPPPVQAEPPEPPSAAEQQAGRDAFSAAGAKLDDALRSALGAQHRAEAYTVNFEGFLASLYMSGMFQLGMLREEGQQPEVDLVGARHTIDTLTMLEEKTRGNLSDNERAVLQDCLFRLRMAFVEITNALTRLPAPGAPQKK